MSIKDFSDSVESYGQALTVKVVKQGVPADIIKNYKLINDLLGASTLVDFFENIIYTYFPEKIIVSVKKKTGTSFNHGKLFTYTVPNQEGLDGIGNRIKTTAQKMVNQAAHKFQSRDEREKTPAVNSPLELTAQQVSYYEKQIERLERDLSKSESKNERTTEKLERLKESYEDKTESLKEKLYETRRELDTANEKFDLERTKERLSQENSLGAVIKSLKPELSALLIKNRQEPPKVEASQGQLGGVSVNPNTKLGVLVSVASSLNETDFNEFYEVFCRFGQLEPADRTKFFKSIAQATADFDSELDQYNNLKIK